MGLFARRTRPADLNTAAVGGNASNNDIEMRQPNKISRRERRQHDNSELVHNNDTVNSRPSFGQWIKVTWPDILTMIAMGLIALGIYKANPAPSRSFPVFFPSGDVVYPQFAYPLRHEIIPVYASALMSVFIPIAIFLIMQLRIRSFWDVNNAVLGLLYAIITAAVFQVFLKWLIGGMRPHFLAVCKPNVSQFDRQQTGNGFANIMYDRKICTGNPKEINDALESFPSGHTTAAFAGFVFLYLYLNAKLKVWSNYHPAYWKLIVTYMPILGAVLIGGALTIDEYHNWYDIVAGAIIGTMMAFSAYRMVYASVWDFRFNHIPLTRYLPFTYGGGPSAIDGFHDAMWTRQAGWGTQESSAWGGAPFDAAEGPRGSGTVMSGAHSGAGAYGDGHGRHASTEGMIGSSVAEGYNGRDSVSRKPVVANSPVMGRVEHMG
ncbi:hypothetical protein LTR08_000079 [Meristemomyces frigidus]|nr:hypothetical protein LTR08_000079 [Meristemomyces frigidus]